MQQKSGLFFKEKISESICKPKELWESPKYLGTPNKTLISNFNAMEDNDTLTYDTQLISTVFKNVFSNLTESLPTKLPNPLDKYNLESVTSYYSSFTITYDFCLNKTSKDKALKIILKIDIFENICDWFVDNKLNIYFGDDKVKSILFASK